MSDLDRHMNDLDINSKMWDPIFCCFLPLSDLISASCVFKVMWFILLESVVDSQAYKKDVSYYNKWLDF